MKKPKFKVGDKVVFDVEIPCDYSNKPLTITAVRLDQRSGYYTVEVDDPMLNRFLLFDTDFLKAPEGL